MDVAKKKPSANKNIRKLRTVSAVCSLAKSWQQWVSEKEEKQAREPSGWSPTSVKEVAEAQNRRPTPSKKPTRPLSAPSEDALYVSPGRQHLGGIQPLGEINGNISGRIKSKQVVKTVTSSAQEKSVGIGILSERYTKEPVQDVDKILFGRHSPTRRRKCSNLVSELTKGWKEKEKEKQQKAPKTLGGDRTCSVDTEDSGFSEMDERGLEGEVSFSGSIDTVNSKDLAVNTDQQNDVDEMKKISSMSKKYSPVSNLKSKWQNWASEHAINQKLNPFSDEFDYDLSMSTRLRKGQEGYGRPKEGSKTAERAKRAEAHIHREIDDLCFIIRTMVDPDPDGWTRVTFGELFDRYVRISDKVVGILMRARKHGKVAFEGEMLWQGRDDHIIITLLV
ncbi:actin-binding Rho-activating protein-like [Scleropages formosus]|uniref:Actin-binding Rho-activating protein n=1 Tax=Scleropages formosus TaxID=113540 RepID=A0A0P7ZGU2_SCLFO|nr:actin-binding Rho-activating protein-like [Scleropages formosus]